MSAPAMGCQLANDDTCTVDDLQKLIASGARFGSIYADPPWLYDNQGTRAATGNHYGGLTVDQLCELPVRELAADDAHLHLWTTNGFLFECPRIFDAWGFEFRSSFVWTKRQMGIGNYWRNSHEFLLTAIRGNAKRFRDKSLKSWLECDRGKHSAKPEQMRSYIERASPGPFLELFGRSPATGWTVFGDQISRNLLFHDVREVA
jgi:N6-adenosine-specific RNA methylase IME4